MKEIGGYLGLDELINNPLHKECIELNSGRAALQYLIHYRKIKTLFLPFYLCDSVFNYIDAEELNVIFYHVDDDFHPVIDIIDSNTAIYIVNYFGFISNKYVRSFQKKYAKANVIFDNTHAFFLEPLEDVDTIYSCRKYFGVPDGAYLYTDKMNTQKIEINKVSCRVSHIVGREETSASAFYSDYINNDALFDSEPIKAMSRFSKKILGAIDYAEVINRRNKNFNYLRKYLDPINSLDDKLLDNVEKGAFCYPLLVRNTAQLRNSLISHKIYIPTLWPNVTTSYGANFSESNLACNILPIPCDQRYDESDMDHIINVIKKEECR